MLEEKNNLLKYISIQINNIFPSVDALISLDVQCFEIAIQRTRQCLDSIKACNDEGFNYLNSGQYATFIYYFANTYWSLKKNTGVATKLFLLNKALNGIDLYYDIEFPANFIIGHTVGMVFAKAKYGNYCVFHQGCTVGRNKDNRPVLEDGIILFPHASVIGKCLVRENTVVSPGVQLVNQDTPGNCYVFSGINGKPVFKEINEYFADRYFNRKTDSVDIWLNYYKKEMKND